MIPLPDQPLSAEGIYLLMFRPILTGLVFNEIFEQVFWHPRSASRPSPIWRLTQTFLKRRRSNAVNNSLAIKKSQHPISVNWPWLFVKHQPVIMSFYPFSEVPYFHFEVPYTTPTLPISVILPCL